MEAPYGSCRYNKTNYWKSAVRSDVYQGTIMNTINGLYLQHSAIVNTVVALQLNQAAGTTKSKFPQSPKYMLKPPFYKYFDEK